MFEKSDEYRILGDLDELEEAGYADAVDELLRLGYTPGRIARELDIPEHLVRRRAKKT